MLIVGLNMFVSGVLKMVRFLGMSLLMIGLMIVVVGILFLELVVFMVVCWKGECDIVVGNVIGSNFFNIFGVLGIFVIVVL